MNRWNTFDPPLTEYVQLLNLGDVVEGTVCVGCYHYYSVVVDTGKEVEFQVDPCVGNPNVYILSQPAGQKISGRSLPTAQRFFSSGSNKGGQIERAKFSAPSVPTTYIIAVHGARTSFRGCTSPPLSAQPLCDTDSHYVLFTASPSGDGGSGGNSGNIFPSLVASPSADVLAGGSGSDPLALRVVSVRAGSVELMWSAAGLPAGVFSLHHRLRDGAVLGRGFGDEQSYMGTMCGIERHAVREPLTLRWEGDQSRARVRDEGRNSDEFGWLSQVVAGSDLTPGTMREFVVVFTPDNNTGSAMGGGGGVVEVAVAAAEGSAAAVAVEEVSEVSGSLAAAHVHERGTARQVLWHGVGEGANVGSAGRRPAVVLSAPLVVPVSDVMELVVGHAATGRVSRGGVAYFSLRPDTALAAALAAAAASDEGDSYWSMRRHSPAATAEPQPVDERHAWLYVQMDVIGDGLKWPQSHLGSDGDAGGGRRGATAEAGVREEGVDVAAPDCDLYASSISFPCPAFASWASSTSGTEWLLIPLPLSTVAPPLMFLSVWGYEHCAFRLTAVGFARRKYDDLFISPSYGAKFFRGQQAAVASSFASGGLYYSGSSEGDPSSSRGSTGGSVTVVKLSQSGAPGQLRSLHELETGRGLVSSPVVLSSESSRVAPTTTTTSGDDADDEDASPMFTVFLDLVGIILEALLS